MIHISTVVEMTQEAETQHHCTALHCAALAGGHGTRRCMRVCQHASFSFPLPLFLLLLQCSLPAQPLCCSVFYFLHHSPMQIHGLTHKVVQLPCCRCSHLLLPPYRIVAAAGSAKGSTTLLTP